MMQPCESAEAGVRSASDLPRLEVRGVEQSSPDLVSCATKLSFACIDEGGVQTIGASGAISCGSVIATEFRTSSGWRFAKACEGNLRLSVKQSGDAQDNDKRDARSPIRKNDKSNVVGRALRTVYDETLREDVPRDFLDLLGKLD